MAALGSLLNRTCALRPGVEAKTYFERGGGLAYRFLAIGARQRVVCPTASVMIRWRALRSIVIFRWFLIAIM
jgi:hypothetical protein